MVSGGRSINDLHHDSPQDLRSGEHVQRGSPNAGRTYCNSGQPPDSADEMKLGERRSSAHTSTDGTSSAQGCPRSDEYLVDADVIEKMLDVL